MQTVLINTSLDTTADITAAGGFASSGTGMAAGVWLRNHYAPWLKFPVGTLSPTRGRIEFTFLPGYTALNAVTSLRRYFFAITAGQGNPIAMSAWFDSSLKFNVGPITIAGPRPTASAPLWVNGVPTTVAFEWDKPSTTDSMRMFIDGVRVSASKVDGANWLEPNFDKSFVFIGSCGDTGGQAINGKVRDLKISNIETALITVIAPFTVKERANSALSRLFPTTAVVPLPYGAVMNTDQLALHDSNGMTVPAQFEVINRHAARDASIRHIMVHLQPAVARWDSALTTNVDFTIRDSGAISPKPINPVITTNSLSNNQKTTVSNSKIYFDVVVDTHGGFLRGPGGPVKIQLTDAAGVLHDMLARTDAVVTVEESGPMRSVRYMSAPTTATEFGWAMRVYMYADKPFVKIEFQLQNAEMVKFAAARTFKSLEVIVPATGSLGTGIVAQSLPIPQSRGHAVCMVAPQLGVFAPNADVAGPTTITSSPEGMVLGLWPRAHSQQRPNSGGEESTSGLYWLDDMQCVVREFYIDYSGTALDEYVVQNPPIAVVDTAWYAKTAVTLDAGGVVPAVSNPTNVRVPDVSWYGQQSGTRPLIDRQGWNYFGCDIQRKHDPQTTGGWPYSVARAIRTGDPADIIAAADFARGELNCMPQWLPGFDFARDNPTLKLTENPYGTYSWRAFENGYGYGPNGGYPPGETQAGRPRDDQHGWFYHVEEAYYLTGDPWIKDWYKFVGQFRRVRLSQLDPLPDMSCRALGHSLSHALQAYRVTGDQLLFGAIGSYIKDFVAPIVDPVLGGVRPRPDQVSEALFQIGYLCRALISYLTEAPSGPGTNTAFKLIEGFVRWNLEHGRFGYYVALTAMNTVSDGSAMTFCDAVAWYCLQPTADKTLADAARVQMAQYISTGLGGGARPYIDLTNWSGDFLGRWVTALKQARGGSLT